MLKGASTTIRRSVTQAAVGSIRNSFETGLPLGTPIDVANSNTGTAGDASSFVDQSTAGCSVVYDNTHVAHGTRSLKFTQASSPNPPGTPTVSWDFPSPQTTVYGRFYYYADAHPSGSVHVLQFWTGSAYGGFIDINPTVGTLTVVDSTFTGVGTSSFGVRLGVWNRIEWKYVADTAVGNVTVKLFVEDGTTPIGTFTSSNGNFGAQVVGVAQWMNAAAPGHVFWIDDIDRNTTGFPGPVAADPWTTTLDTDFIIDGVLPSPWQAYNFANGYGLQGGYYLPSHVVVAGGICTLLQGYETSGPARGAPYNTTTGAGWYQGTMYASGVAVNEFRLTTRMRVVSTNGVYSHRNLPLMWNNVENWPHNGEEDIFESDPLWNAPDAQGRELPIGYFHFYNSTTTRVNTTGTVPGPDYVYNYYPRVDLSQWHVYRVQKVNHKISVWIDNMVTPVWTHQWTETELPSAVKHPVFQQENPNNSTPPAGTIGSEEIQIDWVRLDVPAP